jgi:L-cysteine S-thiosulfotransferase
LLVHAAISSLGLIAAGLILANVPELAAHRVTGDRIEAALDGAVGDPIRGRRIVLNREAGNCLICHSVPEPNEPFQGDLGPELKGVGARLDAGQLRLRLVDQSQLYPSTLMPPYYRVDGLIRVGTRFRGKPVLAAQDIEDVVAYLGTLKP